MINSASLGRILRCFTAGRGTVREHSAFYLAVAGCLCMATTLAVFFTWTYPGNVATKNWTVAPANWEYLRTRWEYSHAANAVLAFASFCLMTLASLTPRR